MDITEVKNELIQHLGSIDKSKFSPSELKVYAETVKIADDMAKPDAAEQWMEAFKTVYKNYDAARPSVSPLYGFGENYCDIKPMEG